MATKNASDAGWVVWVAAFGLFFWFVARPVGWTEQFWYGAKYSVTIDQVHWTKQPSDCDWGRSPLGDKGCHYKKVVTAYNAAGELVAGDNAPTYGHDTTTGKPIVSFDEGKTWSWLPVDYDAQGNPIAHEIDLTVKLVEIGWTKVTD